MKTYLLTAALVILSAALTGQTAVEPECHRATGVTTADSLSGYACAVLVTDFLLRDGTPVRVGLSLTLERASYTYHVTGYKPQRETFKREELYRAVFLYNSLVNQIREQEYRK